LAAEILDEKFGQGLYHLAATAQNLLKLAKFIPAPEPKPA
jgi:hypothetical protein